MDPLTNDERIAALLDGRLSEQERAELLAELGASDDELEILVDSAGITRELEEEDRDEGVIPITVPRPAEAVPTPITRPPVWRRPAVLGLAAAAVLVIGIAPFAWKKFSRPDHPRYFSVAVAELTHPDAAIPPGWSDVRAETRGSEGALSARAVAVRFGALTADLDRAVRAGDRDRAKEYANEIAGLLARHGESQAAREYAQFALRPNLPPADSLSKILDPTPPTLDRENVRLGGWAEAARFAVEDEDVRFFRGRESTRYLDGEIPDLNPAAVDALERVRGARPGAGASDWDQMEQALTELLEEAS
ncbi:MAG TPA: hypothetical protein VF092_07835 [Longimicrobium sp.]